MNAKPKWTSDCVQMREVPQYITRPDDVEFIPWCDAHRNEVKWSGKEPPPPLDTEIVVELNGIGPGKVVGYFVEYGWLGVEVKPHSPPAWWVANAMRHGFTTAFVYGIEYRRA